MNDDIEHALKIARTIAAANARAKAKAETRAAKRKVNTPKVVGRAYMAVWRAIAKGRIPAPNTLLCSYCALNGIHKFATQYHHHSGYDKPHYLDVIPLCGSCHARIHR